MGQSPPGMPRDEIFAALGGVRRAQRNLHATYDPVVRHQVGIFVRYHRELASEFEDMINDVWHALLRNKCHALQGWEPTRGSFTTYLRIVARGLTSKEGHRRLRTHERVVELPEVIDDVYDDELVLVDLITIEQRLEALRNALQQQGRPEDIELFRLYFVEEHTAKHVGRCLGIHEDAVFKRVQRLRKRLQGLWQRLFGAKGQLVGIGGQGKMHNF